MKSHHSHTVSRIERSHSPRFAAGAIAATVMIVLLWVPAFAEENAAADGPAVPPGQENLLLDMFGPGAPLPGCELIDGQVNYTVIKLTYSCSGSEIEYELTHRSKGGRGATLTDQFAVTLTSGSPPRGFADALVSLVRSREAEFEWVWPGDVPR